MRFLFALFLFGIALNAEAADIGGVRFANGAQLGAGQDLIINGVGLRKKLFVKVYAAALYVPRASSSAAEIINGDGARRVALIMLRDVTAKQFNDAFQDGLQDNNSAADLERYKTQIEQLMGLIDGIGEIKKGDTVRVDYLPESGTRIQINGETRGTPLPGADFYRMVLRVWIGDKPVDEDLKTGLLSGV